MGTTKEIGSIEAHAARPGKAAQWLKEVGGPEEDEDEYEWLKKRFLDKFRLSNTSRFQLRTELISMKQNNHESVESYIEKIETKWTILDLSEQSKVDFFYTGPQPQGAHPNSRAENTTHNLGPSNKCSQGRGGCTRG